MTSDPQTTERLARVGAALAVDYYDRTHEQNHLIGDVTFILAKWLFPDNEFVYRDETWRENVGVPEGTVYGPDPTVLDEDSEHQFNPAWDLNDCALALDVIQELGLMGEYMYALDEVVNPPNDGAPPMPTHGWALSLLIATAPQITAALVAVMEANPLGDEK